MIFNIDFFGMNFIYTYDLQAQTNDNSNIAYIKTQNHQIMATITQNHEIKPLIKKAIVANHTFFTAITFSNISSFA